MKIHYQPQCLPAALDCREWWVRPTGIHATLLFCPCRVDATVARYGALKKRLSDLEQSDRAASKLEEKMADLHKRFQTVLSWKQGKVCSSDTQKLTQAHIAVVLEIEFKLHCTLQSFT